MNCSLFYPTEVAKPPKSTPHALEIDRHPQIGCEPPPSVVARAVGADARRLTRDVW
jgi:hypothetical protein